MRIEIHLPDDKNFLDKLQDLADKDNRSRKNYLETVVINHVNAMPLPQSASNHSSSPDPN